MVDWQNNLNSELNFWRYIMADRGLAEGSAADVTARLDPQTPLQDELRALLPSRGAVRILDIGAGPFTTIGKVWGKRKVEIVAIDALADDYDKALVEFGIVPPVRTIKCDGETVDTQFAPNSFGLVHISNALDHCYDPLKVLQAALTVVKPEGHIFLSHAVNEGKFHRYEGLHQWDLSAVGDELHISNRDSDTAVKLPGAQIHCRITPAAPKEGWLIVDIVKVSA